MTDFVALHCHSDYSLLDGAIAIDRLCARVADEGQRAVAITDHGVMYGAWELQTAAKNHGIKPILGMEAYVATGSRRDKPAGKARGYYHLVLLARDLEGYKNLCRLSRHAHETGFYRKPRLDRDLLAQHAQGLIVSSACMAGEVAHHLDHDNWAAAEEAASWYANVFQDRYYLEVQAHGTAGQGPLNSKVFQLADRLGLPVIATNDSHFLHAHDHAAHDVLLCIGLGKKLDDTDRLTYHNGLYFKSGDEMAAAFPDRPDVLANTCAIADSVNVLHRKQYHVPAFPLPADVASEDALLARDVEAGLTRRYGPTRTPTHDERVTYELEVIQKAGYSGYFLIVADFIAYARERGIPVGPGRGSAAGSLVAYALGITNVDPLKYDLLFERFLNPARVSMPDIDVDFCERRRPEVIEYLHQRYGHAAVARIATFSTLKPKQAIKDVGRAQGMSPDDTQALANLVPDHATLTEALASVPELQHYLRYPESVEAKTLQFAQQLEGLARHAGIHAAGVVIAPGPLEEYVPVCTLATKDSQDRVTVAQYDMNALEQAGLLKIDVLGLATLTVLDDACRMIEARHGLRLDLDSIPLDDPQVYARLAKGDTLGVFQFESALATDFLSSMRADRFGDLVAANALLRPGPLDAGMHKTYVRRKLGQEAVTYLLPELETILKTTYGVICYQEQLMQVGRALAGMSLAEADMLRKAVGKKDAALIDAELRQFVDRAIGNGFPAPAIHDIAEQIRTFGRYGFNASHSTAYSLVAYQTAWVKTHYPAEFYAALATSEMGKAPKDSKLPAYLRGARHCGITLATPCINRSARGFTAEGETRAPTIRLGLASIREVGESVCAKLVDERATRGPFASLTDWLTRTHVLGLDAKTHKALIEAGALDVLGHDRLALLDRIDPCLSWAKLSAAEAAAGQASLFGDATDAGTPCPSVPRATPNTPISLEAARLSMRRVGTAIERLPFGDGARAIRDAIGAPDLATLLAAPPRETVPVVVAITSIHPRVSRNGNGYADVILEDDRDNLRVAVFGDAAITLARALDANPLQAFSGTVRFQTTPRGERWTVNGLLPLDEWLASVPAVKVALAADMPLADPKALFTAVKDTLGQLSRGPTNVLVSFPVETGKTRTVTLSEGITLTTEAMERLQATRHVADVRVKRPNA